LLSDFEGLSGFISLDSRSKSEIEEVSCRYPFRVPEFYAGLMERENPLCALRLQGVPSARELEPGGVEDPLGEGRIAVTPSFLTRYPGRGVFLVTAQCAMYCRFCNRRRMVGRGYAPEASREETLAYLEQSRDIREVIVSGGDPLTLPPAELDYILARLREMEHIATIRLSTRMPVVFPEAALPHRAAVKKHGPLWLVIHINHPREISPEFIAVVRAMQEARASVVSQTVLLRGVNDCRHILARLFERLVALGVKPYYLFQLDDVMGATHFKVRLETGMALMRALRASASGLAIPHYALDITDGRGKIPLEKGFLKKRKGKQVFMENFSGEEGVYMDNGEESRCTGCAVCRS